MGTARAFSEADHRFMARALELADGAKGATFPNPSVGAVIVKAGKIVGEGATDRAGGPHAERAALDRAGERARGSTMYATLEPCCHQGRTPPCTDAVLSSGIRRLVAAVRDPNPLVGGKGFARLRRGGIGVEVGLCGEQAQRINEDFFYAIVNKQAWVTLKLALTWDGCVADESGDSAWITSKSTRTFVHGVRRRHAGIAVGRGTVVKDDPELTVRLVDGPSPVRFVFSSAPRLPLGSRIAATARDRRTVVVVAHEIGPGVRHLRNGVEVWQTGTVDPVKSMQSFLRMAHGEGITSVLVEGGSALASFLMENHLVNRLYLCYGNKLLGGGIPGFEFDRPLSIAQPMSLCRVEVSRFGDDVVVTGFPVGS